jgi:cytidylate kinase
MAVIAISQQIGSRGIELGELTANELGYRFRTGEQLIAETATRFNVSAEQMKWFDVHNPHFWERLKTESPRYLAYYKAVMLREAAIDGLVVAGRSSSHFLPENGCGIRVRSIAPFAVRVLQVVADEKLDHSAAEKHVRDFDTTVKARTQSLFGIDLDDPVHYDVTINTARHSLAYFVATLAAIARSLDAEADAARLQTMRDAATAAGVHAALMAHPQIRDAQVEVGCRSGVVRVNGPGLVPPWDDLVIGVARQVEGVASVEVGAEEIPITLTTT